jgi:PAS domain S-box-containing protein
MKLETIRLDDLKRVAAHSQREAGTLTGLCLIASVLLAVDTGEMLPVAWGAAMAVLILGHSALRSRMAVAQNTGAGATLQLVASGLAVAGTFALLPIWLVGSYGGTMMVVATVMLGAAGVRVIRDFSLNWMVGAANLAPLGLVPAGALVWQQVASGAPEWDHIAVVVTAIAAYCGYIVLFWLQLHRAERGAEASLASLEQARIELTENKGRVEQAVKAFGTVVWTVDFDARTVVFSEGADRLFGRTPQFSDFDGRLSPLVHPDDQTLVRSMVRKLLVTGGPLTLEHRIVRADGAIRWVRSTGSTRQPPADRKPGARGEMVMMTIDITARRQRDEELASIMSRASEALAGRRRLLEELAPDQVLAEPAQLEPGARCHPHRNGHPRRGPRHSSHRLARSTHRRRGRQRQQIAVPCQHEPRAAHAPQCHHRLFGDPDRRPRL